jgi:FixJ family two-component response regulator
MEPDLGTCVILCVLRHVDGVCGAPMISIVDDDPFVLQATDALVRSLGYSAATFASAEDFIHSSYIHETTCLISDVQMPGMSGVDLQRVLIAQGYRTPIIFVTAFPDERICRKVMEAGAIGYLTKPFDEETLIKHLGTAFAASDGADRQRRKVQ